MKPNRQNLIIMFLLLCSFITLQSVLSINMSYAIDKQLQKLLSLVNGQPDDANAHFNLGVYYFQGGQFEESIAPLKKACSLNTNDDEARVILGTAYLQVGNPDAAESEFQKALNINPRNIDAQNNISLVYYTQKKYDEAAESFQKSLKIDPENVPALNNLSSVYLKQNKFEEAVKILKKIIRLKPNSEQIYHNLAMLYFENAKYDDVIKLYNDAKGAFPESGEMLKNLGFAYYYKKDLKLANGYFLQGKKQNPGAPENYYGLGLVAYRKADLDLAVQNFKQAIKLKKDYDLALQHLAMTYEDKGDYTRSIFYYRKLMKILPNNKSIAKNYLEVKEKAIDYFLRTGSQAYFDGNFREAIRNWGKVKKLDANNKNALKFIRTAKLKLSTKIKGHNNRAESFYRRGMHQDAYREWRAVLALNPKDKQASEGMKKVKLKQKEKDDIITAQAMAKVKTGNLDAALKDLKAQLKNSPKNVEAQKYASKIQVQKQKGTEEKYRQGVKLLSKNQYRAAIKFLEEAAEADPKDQSIKNLLYKARTQLRETIKALLARGDELATAGRIAEAKEKYNEVLEIAPGNSEASNSLTKLTGKVAQVTVSKEEIKKLYYDGVSLYLDGQNKRAIEVWQKILVLDPNNQEAKSSILKAEMELKEMEKRGIQAD